MKRHVSVQDYVLGRLRHPGELSVVRSTIATTAMLGTALLVGLPGVPWVQWTLLGIGARLDRRTRPGLAPRARQGEEHERA